jgi:hypothetical protein
MRTSMTKLEGWFLTRLLKKLVIQGNHGDNIEDLYRRIRIAVIEEFPEDTVPTINTYLKELFENTQQYYRIGK